MSRCALVFDFFGVICSEIAPFWLAKYLPQDDATKIKASIVHAADLGILSQRDLFNRLGEIAHVSPDQVETEWWSYVSIDEDVVELIKKLKPTYTLGLLTNSPSPFVRKILQTYNLSALFDAIVVSSEERCAKPDHAIYERILVNLSIDANHALLIDDNPVNVKGAIDVGMKGLVFESSAKLRQILSAGDYLQHS